MLGQPNDAFGDTANQAAVLARPVLRTDHDKADDCLDDDGAHVGRQQDTVLYT